MTSPKRQYQDFTSHAKSYLGLFLFILSAILSLLSTFFVFTVLLAGKETPKSSELGKQFGEHGSQSTTIKWGPFLVPASSEGGGMKKWFLDNVEKPCTDCLITFIQAGLKYSDGSYANSDTDMWLHHTVLFDTTQPDPACPKSNVSRIFASGNERTPVDLTDNGAHKTGLYVSPTTEFSTLVELMNGASEAREAILSITFEYVPGVPAGFKKTTMLWLDVGGCYKSSDMPGYENALFEYASEPLVGNVAGTIVFTGGHLHDGGTHVDILKNGNLVCNSTASYGETAGYLDGNKATKGMPHVSSMVTCLSAGTLEPGEAVSLVAHYDTKEHLAMKEMDGTISPVMGIAMLYIMVD